jgi:outer membrane protein TolC
LALLITAGCSPEHYKAEADKEVYEIINGKWKADFGQKVNYTISDVPPSPNDIQVDKVVLPSHVISLAEAVSTATARNREYQQQKEQLYLTALDLTLARHRFARQWFGTIDASFLRDSQDRSVSYNASTGFNQLLADGAAVSANIALDWAQFLTGDPRTTMRSFLSAQVTQPLLRGSGRKIVQENLTQAERNALYQIRSFSRYRQSFVVSIIDAYYRVLQRKDEVTNAENDYKSRVDSSERVAMEAQAGRKPPFEVDQAKQSELTARDNLLRSQQRYEFQLDDFKIMLSLPTDAEVVLDQNELDVLRKTGVTEPNYTPETAVETALAQRLDLANSRDAVDDAERKVVVAADNLGAELNLIGSANVTSPGTTEYRRLEFQRGTYTLGLEADLPFERKAERNAYRESVIALTQRQREHENYVDQVKLGVRDAYRTLREEAESYRTQQISLDLAKERVQSTTMLLQAGRVTTRDWLDSQDALLRAQNSLTAALVAHAVTKLSFFRDIGILQVRPDGMCEQWEAGQPPDAQDSAVKPSTMSEKPVTEQLVELDNSSTRANRAAEESASRRQVDFRDFLAQPDKIWDK